ncbi:hypothetical protein JCM10212_005180 [Sporobolomyces blumeae]
MAIDNELWRIPVSDRPSHGSLWATAAFVLVFNLGILSTFLGLVALYPLRWTRLNAWYMKLGKRTFGRLLVLVSQACVPMRFVVTRGPGVSPDWVVWDETRTQVERLNLPDEAVWIANHQTLADWFFLWQFLYQSTHSASLFIALKSSLRAIPVIGQACGWFGFAFLDRKWSKDEAPFGTQLDKMADAATQGRDASVSRDKDKEGNLSFLLFPEGTIVTDNTRGISTKFAKKTGVTDFEYTLLPRSTGLFFALRRLASQVPSLSLIDLTVGYPLPSRSTGDAPLYPSQFYTLPSIFLKQVPPEKLHVHVRCWKVAEIPLGDLGLERGELGEGTEHEKKEFEEWLMVRWKEKDELLREFNETGQFPSLATDGKDHLRENGRAEEDDDDGREPRDNELQVEWDVRLREPFVVELSKTFGFGVPFLLGWYVLGSVTPYLIHAVATGFRLARSALVDRHPGDFDVTQAVEGTVDMCGCGKKGVELVSDAIGEAVVRATGRTEL